jgi:hypothetical protein
MSSLAIRRAVADVIKRPIFCFTVWRSKWLSTQTSPSLINVSEMRRDIIFYFIIDLGYVTVWIWQTARPWRSACLYSNSKALLTPMILRDLPKVFSKSLWSLIFPTRTSSREKKNLHEEKKLAQKMQKKQLFFLSLMKNNVSPYCRYASWS